MADRIAIDPNVLGGKPVIRGTRIPVHLILDLLATGNTRGAILREYPQLEPEDIAAALRYASSLLEGEVVQDSGV